MVRHLPKVRASAATALAVALTALASCSGGPNPEDCDYDATHPCDTMKMVASKVPSAGSVVWKGRPIPLVALRDAKADGCVLDPFNGVVYETPAGRGPTSSNAWYVSGAPNLTCTVDGGTMLGVKWFTVEGFDLRVAPVGPVSVQATWGFTPQPKNEKAYGNATCTMTVESGAGGIAPFPALVTPDFRRTVRYTCTSDWQLSLELTATVEVDASMFKATANDTCFDGCAL